MAAARKRMGGGTCQLLPAVVNPPPLPHVLLAASQRPRPANNLAVSQLLVLVLTARPTCNIFQRSSSHRRLDTDSRTSGELASRSSRSAKASITSEASNARFLRPTVVCFSTGASSST
jgi:hypothetical protein